MELHQNIDNNFFINIFKGVGIAFIITIVLLLIFSAILTFTNINENVINDEKYIRGLSKIDKDKVLSKRKIGSIEGVVEKKPQQ